MSIIRKLKEEDIASILDIYNWYIQNGTETFETEPLTLDTFGQRVHGILASYPFLVLEEKGRICGYAYLDHFNTRAAYDWTADLSIYLDPLEKGKGYGSALMQTILNLGEKDGYHNIISIITETNIVSKKFHQKFGFQKMAEFPQLGYKFGKWLGVTYYLKHFEKEPLCIEKVKNLYE